MAMSKIDVPKASPFRFILEMNFQVWHTDVRGEVLDSGQQKSVVNLILLEPCSGTAVVGHAQHAALSS